MKFRFYVFQLVFSIFIKYDFKIKLSNQKLIYN